MNAGLLFAVGSLLTWAGWYCGFRAVYGAFKLVFKAGVLDESRAWKSVAVNAVAAVCLTPSLVDADATTVAVATNNAVATMAATRVAAVTTTVAATSQHAAQLQLVAVLLQRLQLLQKLLQCHQPQ